MQTVDARGMSCPQPVLMTKKAAEKNSPPLTVIVDNQTAVENVSRFLKHSGFSVSVTESGEDFHITGAKK